MQFQTFSQKIKMREKNKTKSFQKEAKYIFLLQISLENWHNLTQLEHILQNISIFMQCGKYFKIILLWSMMIFLFQDFVTGLSILSRGSIDEKLRWTFSLYDINGDGCITREEMTDIVTAVYELMGKFSDPNLDHEGVREKVDRMFQVRKENKSSNLALV